MFGIRVPELIVLGVMAMLFAVGVVMLVLVLPKNGA
jgi:hypothetical protein